MIWARIFSQWPPWPPPQLQLQGDHSSQTFQTQSCLGHSLDEPQEDWPNIQKSIWEEAYLHMLVMLMANCTQTYGANFTKKNTWQSVHTAHTRHTQNSDFGMPLASYSSCWQWLVWLNSGITSDYTYNMSQEIVKTQWGKLLKSIQFTMMKHEHVQRTVISTKNTIIITPFSSRNLLHPLELNNDILTSFSYKNPPIHQAFDEKPVHHGMAWLLPGSLRNPDLQWNVPCGIQGAFRAVSFSSVNQGPILPRFEGIN